MMRIAILCLALACVACNVGDLAPREEPAAPLAGSWVEVLPQGNVYFEGAVLYIDATRDSVQIKEDHWTDFARCDVNADDSTQECSDFRWENFYVGKYRWQDSVLTLEYAFVRTTAARLTHNTILPAGRAEFKTSLDSAGRLVLDKTSAEVFIWHKDHIVLKRPPPVP